MFYYIDTLNITLIIIWTFISSVTDRHKRQCAVLLLYNSEFYAIGIINLFEHQRPNSFSLYDYSTSLV